MLELFKYEEVVIQVFVQALCNMQALLYGLRNYCNQQRVSLLLFPKMGGVLPGSRIYVLKGNLGAKVLYRIKIVLCVCSNFQYLVSLLQLLRM